MKSLIVICIIALGLCSQARSEIIFKEDFQSERIPDNFILLKNDGQTPIEGLMKDNPSPWIAGRHPGIDPQNYFAMSSSAYGNNVQADNWMILPKINIKEDTWLYWNARNSAIDPNRWESYQILVSPNASDNSADFQMVFEEKIPYYNDDEKSPWFQRKLNLSEYDGKEIRIAFRCVGKNGFLLFIDDIEVRAHTGMDASVRFSDLAKYHLIRDVIGIKAEVFNKSAKELSRYNIGLDIYFEDGSQLTKSMFEVNGIIEPQKSDIFVFQNFTPWNTGIYTLIVTVTAPNGEDDADPGDNTFVKKIVVMREQPEKQLLLEKFTGTWCGHCPKGDVVLKNRISRDYGYNLVSIHQGDVMATDEGNKIIDLMANGYPSMMIDRHKFAGQSKHAVLDYINWENFIQKKDKSPTPVDVSFTAVIKNTERLVEVKAEIDFIASTFGVFKVLCYVTENNVSGGAQYNQANYANTDPNWIELNGLGNPIVGYVHNNVLRMLEGGAWGSLLETPEIIAKNDNFNATFVFNLPDEYNADEIEIIVAVIEEYDGATDAEALNSRRRKLTSGTSVRNDLAANTFNIFPNPAVDFIEIILPNEFSRNATISIFDIMGNRVYSKRNIGDERSENIRISLAEINLAQGVYSIVFEQGNHVKTKTFVIKK